MNETTQKISRLETVLNYGLSLRPQCWEKIVNKSMMHRLRAIVKRSLFNFINLKVLRMLKKINF
jgi:hypothetical protein